MNREDEDEVVERYLKNFRPRAAQVPPSLSRPLSRRRRERTFWASGFAIATVVAAMFVLVTLRKAPIQEPLNPMPSSAATRSTVTVIELSVVARDDEALEKALSRSAQTSLPRTNHSNSALNALSKD
jgi:hypothetical protein